MSSVGRMTVVIKKEFLLSGSGGQGIILAGIIFAEAAVAGGYHVVQTQSYGPEARGGASRTEVIISDSPIDFPKVTCPDLVLALTAEAYDKYCGYRKEDGLVVADSGLKAEKCPHTLSFPILDAARKLGKEITANMVSLGVISSLSGLIPKELLLEAITGRVPPGTAEINLCAFLSGYEMVYKGREVRTFSKVNQLGKDADLGRGG